VRLLFQYSLLTVTDFKFDKHVSRDPLDMTPLKFFEKRAWSGTHNPLHFGELNDNCANVVIDTDFKFEKHVPWDSSDMTFKNFSKRGRIIVSTQLKLLTSDFTSMFPGTLRT